MTVDIATLAIRIDSVEAREAARDMDRLSGAGRRAEQQGGALSGAMRTLAGILATMKVVEFAESLVKTQREFDKLNSSLITATGSVGNAAQAFGALQAFAASTPYGLAEVTKAFIQLRNLGLTPSERALNSYGNTASAMGKSLNQMAEAVADAATGEFERLKEFGIKAKQNGDVVSLTFQGVTSNIKNNAASIEKYLIGLGETKFAGGMELQAKTLDGAISNLGDTWEMTKLSFSQSGFGDGALASVLGLTNALQDLQAVLRATGMAADNEGKAVEEAGALHKVLTATFELAAVSGELVAFTLRAIGKDIGAVAAAAGAIATGNFSQVGAILKARKEDAAEDERMTDARIEKILWASAVEKKVRENAAAEKAAEGRDDLARYAVKQAAAGPSIEAIKKEAEAYAGLITSIRSAIAENRVELAVGSEATESQKTSIKVAQELASGKLKLGAAHLASVRAALAEQAATEQLIKTQQAEKDVLGFIIQSTQARVASKDALAAEYAAYGQSADAREVALIAVRNEAEVEKFLIDQRKAGKPVTDEMVGQLKLEAAERTKVEQATMAQSKALGYAASLKAENTKFAAESIADPKARAEALLAIDADVWKQRIKLAGDGTEAQRILQGEFNTWYANQSTKLTTEVDLTRATEVLRIMEAVDSAARQAAAGMEASFGAVGKAIGGLTTALTGYQKAQATVAAQLAASLKESNGDPSKIAKANALAAQQGAQAQIKSYGDMAGAAKGFFSENSKGYKILEGAEKAYRAAEMAMAIESMVVKSGLLTAFTGLFVASKTTEVAATAATVPATLVAEGVKQTALATTAMAGAVAVPFPGNLAAVGIVAAMLAAIGLSGFGGSSGGGKSAADVQKTQGTGSVFGDSAAKSDSIIKSINMLKANSDLLIPINQGMLTSLQSIEASMNGLTNLVVRTTGLTDGTNMGISTGTSGLGGVAGAVQGILGSLPLVGGILGKLASLWGKTTQNIVDSGLQYGGSIRGLQAGSGFNQYASVDTTTSSWFGLSKSTSNSVKTQGLNDELSRQFGLIFSGLDASLQAAAVAMGGSAADVAKVLDGLTLESTKVSLKGLTGTALTDALNSVISKSMDEISSAVFPQFEQFRQVGEGYAETVLRLAGDYAKLDSILAATSSTFGMTGAASIAARERVIELAGGIDSLAAQTTSFAKDFLSEAEQLAPVQKYVTEQLAAMGLQSLDTRDKFKDYVLGLIASGALATEAGAQQYAALMKLESAFAKVVPAIEDTSMTLEKAKNTLADAYSAESDAIKSTISSTQDYVKSLMGLRDSMLIGNLSPLTPQQQYAEASRQYEATKAAALGGDATAQSNLSNAMTAFLTASRTVNASNDKYKADFAETQADLAYAIATGKTQVSAAEASLIALNKQVAGLMTVNESVLSVSAAIKQLSNVMGASSKAAAAASTADAITSLYQNLLGRMPEEDGLKFWTAIANNGRSISDISSDITQSPEYKALHGSHANGLAYVPFNKYRAELHEGEGVLTKSENLNYRTMGAGLNAALVAEIKALRSEVSQLRSDQAQQTTALIISNVQATAQAADKVADATVSSSDSAAWASKTAPKVI